MDETRRTSSARATRAAPTESPLDDWLGEVSDDDWSEQATERAAHRRGTSAHEELPVPAGEPLPDSGSARPPRARPVAAVEARRAGIERRRLLAGVVLAMLLAAGIATPVVLLTGGEQATVTQPTTTTAPTETGPETTPATTPTTPTQPTDTTPPPADAASFTLPEGVKLQREGVNDPELVSQLQEALAEAGFDAGPADGTFGEQTEAAVVAFQQANGLSVDGRVGPQTAEALNETLASG